MTERSAPPRRKRRWLVFFALTAALALVAGACTAGDGEAAGSYTDIINERGLTDEQVEAALKTYVPSGQWDEYVMFASGGHSGQVIAIGIPSMRILKNIAVFTPEPWQGWGYGNVEQMKVLEAGNVGDNQISWGDTHHPALSETNGDYDGQFLFINDKANARVAVIDLRDWETKQILKNPVSIVDHGGTMVTPNTEYVIEGGQYGNPLGWEYAPLEEYEAEYRGMVTFWKFDRDKGRIDESQSFALELPPYWQDLCDAGKNVSEGWVFCNSFNVELAKGKSVDGADFEAGVSAGENDYLHVIDLRKAEELFKAGETIDVKGFPVIPLDKLIDAGVLYFIPEPKSPHGIDISPGGEYMVVSGKLDPHVTIYSFDKIQQAIADKNWVPDRYGVPVLDFDAVKEAQIEVGLGPLHTQFDDKGYAYTSIFLDSVVSRWSLGPPYKEGDEAWKLVGRIPIQYNVGHVAAAEGDTVSPDGNYLVSLNKWSIDRFLPPGPLLPQNLQLIDISKEPINPTVDVTGTDPNGMQLLYDMPMALGEPHYAQIIKADKLNPFEIYPEVGWDPATMQVDPNAPVPGNERVERDGNTVHVYMTAVRSRYTPDRVEVKKGDRVIWHITNIEQSLDATHGFALPGYNITLSLEPGETATFEFTANESGTFPFYCTEFCSALHLEMAGYFLVQP